MSLHTITNQLSQLQITKTKYTFRAYTSSAIPAPKIAKCMSDTIYLTDTTKSLEPVSNLDVPSTKNFWICLRNTQTGEEQMHSKAVLRDGIKRWSQLFANSNLLKTVNLYGKYSFPKLKTPDPEVELWEQTAFRIDNTDFLATVVVDPTLNLSTSYDHVHFCVKTPWLPQTYDAFKNLVTSNSRKLVLYHYAVTEYLSKNDYFKVDIHSDTLKSLFGDKMKKNETEKRENLLDYSLATTIHGEAIVDQAEWQSLTLEACFKSNNLEKSAGSAVVPAVLGLLYPYLFLLDDVSPVEYNVVQPCKYSYMFYMQRLAGCKVWGAVNMCASEDALTNTYDQFPFQAAKSYVYSGQIGLYLNSLSLPHLKKMLAKVKETYDALEVVTDTRDHNLIEFWEHPLKNDENEVSSKSREDFLKHLKYYGLRLMERDLEEAIRVKETLENTQIVDHFLKQLLNSQNNEPFAAPTDNKTWTTVIDALVVFLSKLVDQFNTDQNPGVSASTIYTKLVNESSKTITYEQGIAFIRACMGSTPDKWLPNVQKELDLTATQLLKVILFMPTIFKIFFSSSFFEDKSVDDFLKNKLGGYLAQNQTTFAGSVVDNAWTNRQKPANAEEAKKALIYKCFDMETSAKENFGWQ